MQRTWRSVGPQQQAAAPKRDADGDGDGDGKAAAASAPAGPSPKPLLPMYAAYGRAVRVFAGVRSLPAFEARMNRASAAALQGAAMASASSAAAAGATPGSTATSPAAAAAADASGSQHAAVSAASTVPALSSRHAGLSPAAAETAIFTHHLGAPLELLLSLLATEGSSASAPANAAVLSRTIRALQEALVARRVFVVPSKQRPQRIAAGKTGAASAAATAVASEASSDAASAAASHAAATDVAVASPSEPAATPAKAVITTAGSGAPASAPASAEAAAPATFAPAPAPAKFAQHAKLAKQARGAPRQPQQQQQQGIRSRPLHPAELVDVLRLLAASRLADSRTLALLCSAILEGIAGAANPARAAPQGSSPIVGVGFGGVVPEALLPDEAAVALSSLASLAGGRSPAGSSAGSGSDGGVSGNGSGSSSSDGAALPRAAEELAAALLPLLSTRMGGMHASDLCFLARALGTASGMHASGRGAAVAPALVAHVGAQIAARVRSPKDDALPQARELGGALVALAAAGVRSHKAVEIAAGAATAAARGSGPGSGAAGASSGAAGADGSSTGSAIAAASNTPGLAGASAAAATAAMAAAGNAASSAAARSAAAASGALPRFAGQTLPTRAADVALAHAVIRILPSADPRGVVAIARAASRFGLVGTDASVRSPGRQFAGASAVAAGAGEDPVWAAIENRLAVVLRFLSPRQLAGLAAAFARASRLRSQEIRLAMGTYGAASRSGLAPGAGPTGDPAVGTPLLWNAMRAALLPRLASVGRAEAVRVAWAFSTVGLADVDLLAAVSLRMLGQFGVAGPDGSSGGAAAAALADLNDDDDGAAGSGSDDEEEEAAGATGSDAAAAAAAASGDAASIAVAAAPEAAAAAPASSTPKPRKVPVRQQRRERWLAAKRVGALHHMQAARGAAADGAMLLTALAPHFPLGSFPQPHADATAVQLLRVAAALAQAVPQRPEGDSVASTGAGPAGPAAPATGDAGFGDHGDDSSSSSDIATTVLAVSSPEAQAAIASAWVGAAGPVSTFLLAAMTCAGALPRFIPSHVWQALAGAAKAAAAEAHAAEAQAVVDADAAAAGVDAAAAAADPASATVDARAEQAAAYAAIDAARPQLHSCSLTVPLHHALLAAEQALRCQPDAALRRLPLSTLTEMLTVFAGAAARWEDFAAAAAAAGNAEALGAAEPLTASDAAAAADAANVGEQQAQMHHAATRVLAALRARGLANDTLATLLRRHHGSVVWSPQLAHTIIACGLPAHHGHGGQSPAEAAAQAARYARSSGSSAYGSVLRARAALR